MKREVNPLIAIVVAVILIGGLVFAFYRMGATAPKKTQAELAQHRPSPKIPPLGAAPQ